MSPLTTTHPLRLVLFLAGLLAVWSSWGAHARAQANSSISYSGGTYTENFEGLASSTGAYNLIGNGVFAFGSFSGAAGMEGWYGTASLADAYNSSNGASSTGGFYDFTEGGGQELGAISTSVTGKEVFGVRLVNDTQSTVYTSLDVSFLGELLHVNSTHNSAAISMSFGENNYFDPYQLLPTSNVNSPSGLGFSYANNSGTPPLSTPLSSSFALAQPWLPGQSLWLTWSLLTSANGAPGLGIDNLSVTAAGATSPYLSWNAAANNTWNTSSANWTGASTYADTDFVNFGSLPASGGTVAVAPGGVSPAQINVTNATGTYSISGGSIMGAGALLKSGSGSLILSSSNSYSGGTAVNGGMLVIDGGDNRLGDPSAALLFDGGGARIQGAALVSARSLIVNPGGGFIDTAGFNSSTSGPLSGPGILAKEGLGDFTISGPIGSTLESTGLAVHAGSLTVTNAGTQYVNASPVSGAFAGTLNVGPGVSLNIGGGANFSSPALIDGGGSINLQGSGASLIGARHDAATAGATEIDNNIVLNSLSLAQPFSANLGAIGGALSNQLVIGGTISGASDVNFAAGASGGAGLVIVKSPATYTGNTTINLANTGVLRLGVNDALPVTTQLTFGSVSSAVGSLDLNGFSQTLSALASRNSIGFVANGVTNTGTTLSTLTVNQAIDTTYASDIGTLAITGSNLVPRGIDLNNIALVKQGGGALRLMGNETYTGSTTVSAGTLVVSGAITSTAAVSVASGATLAGAGTVGLASGGKVVIASGAAIAPGDNFSDGNPTTNLTITDAGGSPSPSGTFDLRSGGTLTLSLQALEPGGTQNPGNEGLDSQLTVHGTISLAGNLTGALLDGFTANAGDLFFIILNQGASPVSGTFSGNPSSVVFTGAGGSQAFLVSYHGNATADTFTGGNDVVLEAVPEPGELDLALAALGMLAFRGRMRRRD